MSKWYISPQHLHWKTAENWMNTSVMTKPSRTDPDAIWCNIEAMRHEAKHILYLIIPFTFANVTWLAYQTRTSDSTYCLWHQFSWIQQHVLHLAAWCVASTARFHLQNKAEARTTDIQPSRENNINGKVVAGKALLKGTEVEPSLPVKVWTAVRRIVTAIPQQNKHSSAKDKATQMQGPDKCVKDGKKFSPAK